MRWTRIDADAVRAMQLRQPGPGGRAERLFADALNLLPDATPDALRLRFVELHADLLLRSSKFEPAVRRFQEAITLADSQTAPEWRRADLRASLAYTLFLAGQQARALELNRTALELARTSGDDKTLSVTHTTQAILLGDPALAVSRPAEEQAMMAALAFAKRAGSRREEVRATANLADLYLRRAEYAKAIDYSDRALPLARELNDLGSESVALANAGLGRIMLGQREQGLRFAHASMALDEGAGDLASLAATHKETGHYLEKAGFVSDVYAAYSDYRRVAEPLFRSDLQRSLTELQESFDHEHRRRELDLLERENHYQQAQLVSRQ